MPYRQEKLREVSVRLVDVPYELERLHDEKTEEHEHGCVQVGSGEGKGEKTRSGQQQTNAQEDLR